MIEISTPALLFPAISLLLLAYTNRFLTTGQLIRHLKQDVNSANYNSILLQISNLTLRLNLIIIMQATGVLSILTCTASMIFLFFSWPITGQVFFAISLILMVLSLIISAWEILISGNALRIELKELKIDNQ